MSQSIPPPILLVEDDENDVLFVQRACRRVGVKTALNVATSGGQAIEYLSGIGPFADRAQFPLPCLLLMDLNPTGRSGLEILKWMRAQPSLRHIIVILWSSSAAPDIVRQAYHAGVNSFLIKPGDPEALAGMIELIRAYWLDCNQMVTECEGASEAG